MLIDEIIVEIDKLIKDVTFVRNLSLTSMAIATICGSFELPSHYQQGTEEISLTSIAYASSIVHADITKIIIEN